MREGKNFKWRLGEVLVQKGWITWEQLEEALKVQHETQAEIGDLLVEKGFVSKKKGQALNLGEILVRGGWISWQQLQDALEFQQHEQKKLGEILIDKRIITKKQLYEALAQQFYMVFVDFDIVTISKDVLEMVPRDFAYEFSIMPLVRKGNLLLIAISDPMDVTAESELRKITHNYEIRVALASPEDIQKAIQKYYGS